MRKDYRIETIYMAEGPDGYGIYDAAHELVADGFASEQEAQEYGDEKFPEEPQNG